MLRIPDNLRIENEEYNAVLNIIYYRVEELFKAPLHIHYTDHSVSHSQRIINVISSIISDTKIHFNDEELFILTAAVLLHDIGMQTPHYEVFGQIPLDIESLEKIRKMHHEYSASLIVDSIQCSEQEKYYLGLNSKKEFVDDIALVAKYHRKRGYENLDDDVIGDNVIRLKLLCALMRLGDCLDLDYRRVNIDRLLVFTSIPLESEFFWYAHHYVSGLLIQKQIINIYFKFPKEYEQKSGFADKIIKHFVEDEIKHQLDEVYDILDSYGIRFYKDVIIHKSFSITQKKMPDNLEQYVSSLGADHTYRGVIYGELNIVNRRDLIDSYIKCLENTKSFRNMTMGPIFLSPRWYRERVCANRSYRDFDSMFLEWVLKESAIGVNHNIRLIFRNSERYEVKIKEYLSPNEYLRFMNDTINNIHAVWGKEGEKGPELCCVDPGYMHIITASDNCAIITQRAGIKDPTKKGYMTTDSSEVSKIIHHFDEIFDFNYSSQSKELSTLISFVHHVFDEEE